MDEDDWINVSSKEDGSFTTGRFTPLDRWKKASSYVEFPGSIRSPYHDAVKKTDKLISEFEDKKSESFGELEIIDGHLFLGDEDLGEIDDIEEIVKKIVAHIAKKMLEGNSGVD